MSKQLMALLVIVVAVGLATWRIKSATGHDTSSLAKIAYDFKCLSCGAGFKYTTEELKRFVKQGTFEEIPMQARKFPCPRCGKITGLISVGSYDVQSAPSR